jgi:hypothetical protein
MACFMALNAVACGEDECPLGSVEFEGQCVTLVGRDGGLACGPGTEVVNGQCWPTEAVCGPNTDPVWEEVDGVRTGVLICVGKSGTDQPPECPESVGGTICVNGWVRYLADPDDPSKMMTTLITSDATLVEVRVYDPLAYAANSSVAPLATAQVNPENGTFMVSGIVVPVTGFIALAVVDYEEGGGAEFVFTGFPYPALAGTNIEGVAGYAVTAAQNEAWSAAIGGGLTSAGCALDRQTLHACGTWIGVFGFMDEEGALTQLPGVVPRNGGGNPPPAIPNTKVFFPSAAWDGFSQPATPEENYTNETGTVLFPTASLSQFTGSCADLDPDSACEAGGYFWPPPRLGGAAPNAIFVQLMYPDGYQ